MQIGITKIINTGERLCGTTVCQKALLILHQKLRSGDPSAKSPATFSIYQVSIVMHKYVHVCMNIIIVAIYMLKSVASLIMKRLL